MRRTLKVVLISLFAGIIVELYYIHENPLIGYNLSLYTGISKVIYTNIFLFILGTGLVIKHRTKGDFLHISLVLFLVMLSAIDLLFPYMRGVQLVNAFDTSQHAGFVVSILRSSHINFTYNFYPALHVLAATLALIVDIPITLTVSLVNPVASLTLYPMFIYLLSKEMFKENTHHNLFIPTILALTLPLNYFISLYQSFTVPNGLAYLLFPFYVYALYMMILKNSIKWVTLLTVLTLFFVILHPLANVLLILLILLSCIFENMIISKKTSQSKHAMYFLLIFYVTLYVSYVIYLTNVWTNPLISLKRYLTGQSILSQTSAISQNLAKIGNNTWDILKLTLKTNTASFLFLFISALFLLQIFKKLLIRNSDNQLRDIILLAFYIVSLPFLIVQITAPSVLNIAYYRFLIAMLSLTPVVIYGYYLKIEQKIAIALILILVSTGIIIAYQISYPSPYSNQINIQATTEDTVISAFLLNTSPRDFHLYGYISNSIIGRLFIFHLPLNEYQVLMWNSWSGKRFVLPDHIGYGNHSLNLLDNSYVTLSSRDILAYTKVWKKLERVTWEDMRHINSDNSFGLVYSTGDYWIYKRGV